MTTTDLPAGYRVRRPRAADAPAVYELVSRYDIAVIGVSDSTPQDVADDFADPAFHLDRDGWLVHAAGGGLAGWAWACRKGGSDNVDVDVYVRPDAPQAERVAGWLWDAVLARAAGIAAELGHDRAVVDTGLFRADAAKRARAAALGFGPATTFHRMHVAHQGPVRHPPAPPGVTVLVAGDDADLRRAGHEIRQRAFAEHFGFAPEEYDGWAARLAAAGSHDWSLLRVAAVDGVPAGMLLGGNQFVPDENCGYVRALGVLPEYRGRGLGAYLLRGAFADDAALGRAGTYLHVDTNNSTPALGLYLSVGMRPVLVLDVWRRVLDGLRAG